MLTLLLAHLTGAVMLGVCLVVFMAPIFDTVGHVLTYGVR